MVVVVAVVLVLVVLLGLLVVAGVVPADLADVEDEPVVAGPLDQRLRGGDAAFGAGDLHGDDVEARGEAGQVESWAAADLAATWAEPVGPFALAGGLRVGPPAQLELGGVVVGPTVDVDLGCIRDVPALDLVVVVEQHHPVGPRVLRDRLPHPDRRTVRPVAAAAVVLGVYSKDYCDARSTRSSGRAAGCTCTLAPGRTRHRTPQPSGRTPCRAPP